MELVQFVEQCYQVELQVYQIAFPNFKYEPPSFVHVEIETNSKISAMPSMVLLLNQLVL
jgi:hypothetical protein